MEFRVCVNDLDVDTAEILKQWIFTKLLEKAKQRYRLELRCNPLEANQYICSDAKSGRAFLAEYVVEETDEAGSARACLYGEELELLSQG